VPSSIVVALALVLLVANLILAVMQFRRARGDPEKAVREELREGREDFARTARDLREELTNSLSRNGDSLLSRFDALQAANDARLRDIQQNNARKLDEIRRTVDEQLQGALEKRLTESFKLVGGQLEAVQRGLGEMQALAAGVGDLKRVLSNVKTRGTWAEVQLGAILEQLLTPEQYARNVQTREDARENVEYAIRLPGSGSDPTSCVWLPIDSKFPQESYVRLLDATDAADVQGVQAAAGDLARALRICAGDIRDKYLAPPRTTDFAILFLPTEGLYAEVLRQADLANELQQKYKVLVAGPTTLAALLSSLRMGFRTLAIEQRASEVWTVLGAVKTEFARFGDVMSRVRKQLTAAARTIDDTDVRTRAMERRLRDVEQLPSAIAADILQLPLEPESGNIEDETSDARSEPEVV
jgi:DNA recombination protein RmuC